MHGTDLVTDWQVGSPVYWRGQWNGQSYEDKGTVPALEPGELLKVTHWSPMGGTEDAPENHHVVTYELTRAGGVTGVVVTQSNNPTPAAAESMAEYGWMPICRVSKPWSREARRRPLELAMRVAMGAPAQPG